MTTRANAASASGEFMSRAGPRLVLAALLALALPTGIVAMMQGSGGLRLPFNLFLVDERLPGLFRLHMLASGLSLLTIPTAIFLARRHSPWHRGVGRLAAVCVLAGGLTSLPVALSSESVAMARAGFFAQGIVWLALLAAGVRAIRARNVHDHARYMLAMAAVASGAIWVRLTTTIATGWDLPFDPLYSCAAWAGWLVPLVLVWRFTPALLARA